MKFNIKMERSYSCQILKAGKAARGNEAGPFENTTKRLLFCRDQTVKNGTRKQMN
jgi:hypothetical protein